MTLVVGRFIRVEIFASRVLCRVLQNTFLAMHREQLGLLNERVM